MNLIQFFIEMIDNDVSIKSIKSAVDYNDKLETYFNTYNTDAGFAKALVAEKMCAEKKAWNPDFIGNKSVPDELKWKSKIKLRDELKKDVSREFGKAAILDYIDSCVVNKDNANCDELVDYITAGILVENFFASSNKKDKAGKWFAQLKPYLVNNWTRFDQINIVRYINARKLLIKVLQVNKPNNLNYILGFKDIDVRITDYNGNPVIKYCKGVELIKLLLQKCHDSEEREDFVNMCDNDNKSALYHFTYEVPKDYEIISLLVNNGANVNIDKNGFIQSNKTTNAFVLNTIVDGQYELAQIVLKNKNTNLDIIERANNKTLLHNAVEINNVDIVRIIADRMSADMIDVRDVDEVTALLYAMKNNANAEIVHILLQHGANPNIADKNGKTALFFINNAESLQYLMDNPNTDFEHLDSVGKNFLYYIDDNQQVVTKLKKFLHDNSDKMRTLFEVNKYSENPLHWVTSSALCKLYIQILGKIAVQQKNIRGNTPLHWARTSEIAQLLIDAGADVNAKNDSKATPLHWALNLDVAKTLVEHSANINAMDDMGKTPIMYAEEYENNHVKNYLEQFVTEEAVD